MNRALVITALILPLAGLAASLAVREAELAGAENYVMPVTGFDPRDMLRGHYIRYRYDWQMTGDPKWCADRECRLCLTSEAPDGSQVEIRDLPSNACSREIDWQASGLNLYAVPATTGGEGQESLPMRLDVSGTFYPSESDAETRERELAERPMAMHVDMTSTGRLVAKELTPRTMETDR